MVWLITFALLYIANLKCESKMLAGECGSLCMDLQREALTADICQDAKQTALIRKAETFCLNAMKKGTSCDCLDTVLLVSSLYFICFPSPCLCLLTHLFRSFFAQDLVTVVQWFVCKKGLSSRWRRLADLRLSKCPAPPCASGANTATSKHF